MPTFHLDGFCDDPPALNAAASSLRPFISSVEIVLGDRKSGERRTVSIPIDGSIRIGRASKSELKNLAAEPTNTLFDCAVVSRNHAELRAKVGPEGSKIVTISDQSSLHGTVVNGVRLTPGHAVTLRIGDTIKVGERITRGDNTHDGVSLSVDTINISPTYPSSSNFCDVTSLLPEDSSEGSGDDIGSIIEPWSCVANTHCSSETNPEQPKNVIDLSQDDTSDGADVVVMSAQVARPPPHPIIENDCEVIVVPDSIVNPHHSLAFIDHGAKRDVPDEFANVKASNHSAGEASDISSGSGDNHLHIRSSSPKPNDRSEATGSSRLETCLNGASVTSALPKPRYDPVRSSQILGGDMPKSPTDATPTCTYGSFMQALPNFDIDFCDSGRWDAQLPASRLSCGIGSDVLQALHPETFTSRANSYAHSRPSTNPAITQEPNLVTQSDLAAHSHPLQQISKAVLTVAEGPPAAKPPITKGNNGSISITDIVEEPEQSLETRTLVNQAHAVPAKEASSTTKKRKADSTDDQQLSRRVAKVPRSNRFVGEAVKYASGAVVGAAAAIAFLSSTLAEDLINWLD